MEQESANAAEIQPTLVFLHGWGLNQQIWQQFVALLPDEIPVITLDIPGYGGRAAPTPYTFESVLALLGEQLPQKAVVIGWSLGGLFALKLAQSYPDKVQKVGLIASNPKFAKAKEWPGMDVAVMHKFAGSLAANLALTVERFLALQALAGAVDSEQLKNLRTLVLAQPLPSADTLNQGLTWLAECDFRVLVAALPQPVFGLFGRLDSLVPHALVPHLRTLKPEGIWQLLDKASHAPFLTHPQETKQWLQMLMSAK